MILYHGTVSTYLPAIESEGLKPAPKNGFIGIIGGAKRIRGSKSFVFLTTLQRTARDFAKLRANYLRSPSHQVVMDGDDFAHGFAIIKTSKVCIPDAKPVLLTIQLPEELADKLISDWYTLDSAGYKLKGSISAQYIIKKEVLA